VTWRSEHAVTAVASLADRRTNLMQEVAVNIQVELLELLGERVTSTQDLISEELEEFKF
jgi:hypothetical protein